MNLRDDYYDRLKSIRIILLRAVFRLANRSGRRCAWDLCGCIRIKERHHYGRGGEDTANVSVGWSKKVVREIAKADPGVAH
jgi:hypothetical protein